MGVSRDRLTNAASSEDTLKYSRLSRSDNDHVSTSFFSESNNCVRRLANGFNELCVNA
jgi:hypothetical protein